MSFLLNVDDRDQALQHTLAFGIGIHHAGLAEGDRNVVEALFEQGKIQVLAILDRCACIQHDVFEKPVSCVRSCSWYSLNTCR